MENMLSWIDNLQTGRDSKKGANDLADPQHPDHNKEYVPSYISMYGARKVEANAIVVVPEMGRALCEAAINEYIPADAIDVHQEYIEKQQERIMLAERLRERKEMAFLKRPLKQLLLP